IPRTAVVEGRESLFDRLFNLPAFAVPDGPLPKDAVEFVHPAFRASGVPSPADSTLHRLLAGLQLGADQLAQLVTELQAPLGVDLTTANENDRGFALDVANLTLLYRHARLAQLLRLPLADLFQLIRLAGVAGGHLTGLGDVAALLDFHDWWKSTDFSLDDLAYVTRAAVRRPEAYPDTAAAAGAIVEAVRTQKDLVFADTVFAFMPGVTEEQSRALLAANAGRVEPTPDGAALRLHDTFDPAVPLAVPVGLPVAEPAARAVLLAYHASRVVPVRIAGQLGLPVDRVAALLAMAGADLSAAALVQALHGGPPAPLVTLLDQVSRLGRLFRNPVFDPAALDFVRT
ncbi:MAG TPA: hypothetical protein VFX28_05620, partial [Methylomirabilota bacterium]|nr:hypothetical protein [Methylomirabilota bacterium]